MMNVLIVVPALGQVYGGPSKIALELAEALGHQAVQVDIVTTNANGSIDLDVPLYTWLSQDTYRIQYFPHWRLSDYKISFSLTRWLFRNIKNYDVVHTIAIFSYPVLMAHWACKNHNIPYIMNPQGMLEPWALAYKSWKKQMFYTLFERNALQQASAIQMLSTAEADGIKHLNLTTPIHIIPNGIDRQELEQLPNPEKFIQQFPETCHKTRILFMGRVDPKKGLDLLAPAFAKVRAIFPDVHLIIAGPDNIGFLPIAQSYFATADCLDGVTFTGMLTGDIKTAALAAADIYVAPSYSEGFSMSVLEGMATGLPCVFTTKCNFPEAATAKAAHVVPPDADAIAAALIECLANPTEAKAMGDRARQLISENYTWDQIAIQLIDVYKTILQPPSTLT